MNELSEREQDRLQAIADEQNPNHLGGLKRIETNRIIVRFNYAPNPFALTDAGADWLKSQLTAHNIENLGRGRAVELWNIGTCWLDNGQPDELESRELQSRIKRKLRGRTEWKEVV